MYRSNASVDLFLTWNEYDEGGWICLARNDGTVRLDALWKVLGRKVLQK